MRRALTIISLLALFVTGAMAAYGRYFVIVNNDAAVATQDSTRTLTKSGVITASIGVPTNATGVAFHAEGTITSGVDSGLVAYFRTKHYGRTVKMFTPTDSLAAVMGAGVDTTGDGTRFSIYYSLNPDVIGDSLMVYVGLLDDADADSAKDILTWFSWREER